MFRKYAEMDEIDKLALRLCSGKILDVGAGSGCHSLYLQKEGLEVDALDISPGSVEVMRKQGVKNILHQNLFSLRERSYDTILMLMNGLGICGSIDGVNLFLQFIKTILKEGGQVIADSTDLAVCHKDELIGLDYINDMYIGETECVMSYKHRDSDPFNWLYIDYETLESLVTYNKLNCRCLMMAEQGRYLARIF
jgi:SAM-dependent methyltransferase